MPAARPERLELQAPPAGGRAEAETPIAAIQTKNPTKPMKVSPSIAPESGLSASPIPAKTQTPTASQPIHRRIRFSLQDRQGVHRHDDTPEHHVPCVVENQGERGQRVEGVRVDSRAEVGDELVGHRDRKQVRDRHEGEAEYTEDRREHEPVARSPQVVVEPDQADEAEDAAHDHEPGPEEERAARVVDVGDPVEPVLAGLGDEDLHAACCHERDAGDEGDDRADRTPCADPRQAHRPTISR